MSDLRRPFDSAHPVEVLVGLVDGTLTSTERAELQAHLDGCERCRSEAALAESAAGFLRVLPEIDAPWGLGRAAIEEARRDTHPMRRRRFAMVAAVAAAVILVVGLSVAVLRNPQEPSQAIAPANSTSGATTGGAAGGAERASGPVIVHSTQDFSSEDVADLATSYSMRVARSVLAPKATSGGARPSFGSATPSPAAAPNISGAATSGAATSGPTALSGPTSGGATSGAVGVSGGQPGRDVSALGPVACVDTAAGYAPSTTPIRVIDARFEEKPALIGIFLRGPGADRPADLVVVWVASKDCEVLSYASHRVSP